MDYQVRGMPHEVTELLNQWSSGDQAALEQLMSLVYAELHKLARGHMRRTRWLAAVSGE